MSTAEVHLKSTSEVWLQALSEVLPLGILCCCRALKKVQFHFTQQACNFFWWSRGYLLLRYLSFAFVPAVSWRRDSAEPCWRCGPGWGHSQCSVPLHPQPWGHWRGCARVVPSSQPSPTHHTQRRDVHATTAVHFNQSRITSPVQQALCFLSNKTVGKELRQNPMPARWFPFLSKVLLLQQNQ